MTWRGAPDQIGEYRRRLTDVSGSYDHHLSPDQQRWREQELQRREQQLDEQQREHDPQRQQAADREREDERLRGQSREGEQQHEAEQRTDLERARDALDHDERGLVDAKVRELKRAGAYNETHELSMVSDLSETRGLKDDMRRDRVNDIVSRAKDAAQDDREKAYRGDLGIDADQRRAAGREGGEAERGREPANVRRGLGQQREAMPTVAEKRAEQAWPTSRSPGRGL